MRHLVRPAVGVEQERRAQRPGLADRATVMTVVSPAAGVVEPQVEQVLDVGVHHRDLPQIWCDDVRFQLTLPS